MPGHRSDVAEFDHRLEANVLLNARREVISQGCFGIDFDCRNCTRRVERTADQIEQIVNVAKTHRIAALQRRIPTEAARAAGAAAYSRAVIDAAQQMQNRLAAVWYVLCLPNA